MDDMNEKYQKHYSQLLTGTLTDTLMKNISFQANIKLANEIIEEQDETIKNLKEENENLKNSLSEFQNKLNELGSEKNKIDSDFKRINSDCEFEKNKIKSQYESEIRNLKTECENNKNQVKHLDTFKNELLKIKEENKTLRINYESNIDEINKTYEEKIKELNDEIDYLKLTPAKRKKIDKMISSESEDFNVSNNIEDGGQF